jgi:hypothetical protein
MKKANYVEGQEIELLLIKPQNFDKGKRPVARTEEGIICIVDSFTKGYFPYDSTWICKIKKVFDNKLIVIPDEMIVSPVENRKKMAEKLSFISKNKSDKKKKVKKGYQFMSKQEQLKQ